MSDRSDEATKRRGPDSTDDLLEETERLLSGGGSSSAGEESSFRGGDIDSGKAVDGEPTADSRSSQRSRRSATDYFSPKAFLAFVLVLGAGLFAGGAIIPWIGAQIGLALVAFLAGLLASKRRYVEVVTAGAAVGGVSAVLDNSMLAATGSGQTILAIGAGVAVLACLVGYYFGRDLRDGLSRDI